MILSYYIDYILKISKCPTPPKFNSSPLKSYLLTRKVVVFQAPFFRGKLAVKLQGSYMGIIINYYKDQDPY